MQSKTSLLLSPCCMLLEQKGLLSWTQRSYAELLPTASHLASLLPLEQYGFSMTTFPLQLNMSNMQGDTCERAALCLPFSGTEDACQGWLLLHHACITLLAALPALPVQFSLIQRNFTVKVMRTFISQICFLPLRCFPFNLWASVGLCKGQSDLMACR